MRLWPFLTRPAKREERAPRPVDPESPDSASSALDSIADVPIVRSDSFGPLTGHGSGRSIHLGDIAEMALPAVLIGAALYYGNRAPHAAVPYQPVAPPVSYPSGGASTPAVAPSPASSSSGSVSPPRAAENTPQADPARSAPAGGVPATRPGDIEKQVVLSVEIDQYGSVANLSVLESRGAKADAEAVAAVRKWTFKPMIFNRKPVPSVVTVRYP